MKAIIALEELIKEDEAHIKLAKKQLADHDSGINKLSPMVKGSTEAGFEEASKRLEKNQAKLTELLTHDLVELEKQERIKEAIIRKNYFDFQKKRIKRDKSVTNDIKLEAMMIIDELPENDELGIEDDILYDIAEKSIKMQLSLHERIDDKLTEIKNDFYALLEKVDKEEIKELELLSNQIAVVILHLSVLITNIEENIEEDEDEPPFPGLPKFEDWWIKELWINHQAYFSLFKWKQIVTSLCQSGEQKRAWDIIFSNWISIKKYICNKGEQAFKYNLAFDTLMNNHCGLEEELATTSLESMESIIKKLIQIEDFSKFSNEGNHNIITEYTKFKRIRTGFKDIEKKVSKKK